MALKWRRATLNTWLIAWQAQTREGGLGKTRKGQTVPVKLKPPTCPVRPFWLTSQNVTRWFRVATCDEVGGRTAQWCVPKIAQWKRIKEHPSSRFKCIQTGTPQFAIAAGVQKDQWTMKFRSYAWCQFLICIDRLDHVLNLGLRPGTNPKLHMTRVVNSGKVVLKPQFVSHCSVTVRSCPDMDLALSPRGSPTALWDLVITWIWRFLRLCLPLRILLPCEMLSRHGIWICLRLCFSHCVSHCASHCSVRSGHDMDLALSSTLSPLCLPLLWDLVTTWIWLCLPLCLALCLPLCEILSQHGSGFVSHFVFHFVSRYVSHGVSHCSVRSCHDMDLALSPTLSPTVWDLVTTWIWLCLPLCLPLSLPLCLPLRLPLCFPLLCEILSRHGSGFVSQDVSHCSVRSCHHMGLALSPTLSST